MTVEAEAHKYSIFIHENVGKYGIQYVVVCQGNQINKEYF